MDNYSPAMGCSGCGGGFPTAAAALEAQNIPGNSYTSPASNKQSVGGVSTPTGNKVPSIEDVANYNFMTPMQQEQQRLQLLQGGTTLAPGMPGYSSRSTQMQPVTQMPPASQAAPGGTLAPLTPTAAQAAAISGDALQYLNGFLRTQIGRPVLVTFLVGTNTLTDRSGILLGVGINYILINETQTDDVLACDFYNIKFVRFYY